MKKESGKKLSKGKKLAVIISAVVAVLLAAVLVLPGLLLGSKTASAGTVETVTLKKTDLTQSISVSGVVETAETTSVYSTLNYPVNEILAKVGDIVAAGDVIAVLDTENLQNDIAQAEINYNSAKDSAAEEKRNLSDSVTNAANSLNAAKLTAQQRALSVANAEADLDKAQEDAAKAFDSYANDNTIKEAKITLERKKADNITAQADYTTALLAFDDYKYQNAIADAQITLDRKEEARDDAKTELADANSDYSAAEQGAAEEAAKKALDAAQKAYDNALNAFDDAQRSLDRAKTDLTRAKEDAIKSASDKAEAAGKAQADAQRAYDKALSDKERAANDYVKSNDAAVAKAKTTLSDANKQLESAQNSVKNAENALSQAKKKPGTASKNVDLQKLALDKLNRQLSQSEIVAEASGVITEVNVKVGAVPQGALFVIDNKDQLYVSARVKEYNLNSLEIGQKIIITTDATGDEMFTAELSYISPAAVSEAGSTSVEFEVWANLADPDEAIKIGMNAFLNIVTDTRQDVYAVPISAVVTNETGSFVYALPDSAPGNNKRPGPGNRPGSSGEAIDRQEIPVTLGIKTSTSVEISGKGLKDGLQLLTDPENKLSDGSESGGMNMMPFGGGGR